VLSKGNNIKSTRDKQKFMVSDQPKERIGTGMSDYAEVLEEYDPALARRLDVSRAERFQRVKDLHLPRKETRDIMIDEFFRNPDHFFDQILSPLLYINLNGIRKEGLTREDAKEFIRKNILRSKAEKVFIAEYYPVEYGGNIVINTDQSIIIEFKKGSQGPISAGTVIPEYRVERGSMGVFHYSFDDEELRKCIYDVIKQIPHDGRTYTVGYYEFQLVRKKLDGFLEPVFIDYDEDPAYRNN